jgi:Holliday junction resolvase RusA-like endonuclease
MPSLTFEIPGVPVPKGRARSTKSGHHYTPAKTKAYEQLVALYARKEMKIAKPLTCPIDLEVYFDLPIPQSWSKVKRKMAEEDFLKHTTRPDADNLLKSIKDGCNGVLWADDSQVWRVMAIKSYSTVPRASVIVYWSDVP